MTSHTETTSTVTETINSMDYNTGYQYSATGSGVTVNGNLSPGTGSVNVNINGVTSSWTGATSKPVFSQTTTGAPVSVHRNIQGTRAQQSHDYPTYHRNQKCHRHYKYILPVILSVLFPSSSMAETVGGVSATAAPVANSSGSVTNQAIQVLQGPYITNTYGGGIQCQGPTLNVTPFITGSLSQAPTRTGQKNNTNLSLGFSATWSNPLDKTLQDQCKRAAATQIALQEQLTANKRLDFEIARLKNCGELKKQGIYFHPKSPYYKICADVIVTNPGGVIPPHRHTIPSPSKSEQPYSSNAADLGAPLTNQP
jgi:hypothetical protein